MGIYNAWGQIGDYGYTIYSPASNPGYTPPTYTGPTGAAYVAGLTRYEQGGYGGAPLSIETYTPAGNPATPINLDLPGNTPAPPAPTAGKMTYYSPTGAYSPYSTYSPNLTAPPVSTFAAPTSTGGGGATPTPNVEQVASTATPTPTPQQVMAPTINPTFNPTQLQGLTPTLTPYGGRPGATPYQPSGTPAGGGGRSGGGSGGGTSGGGGSQQPPQQPQKQNPLAITIRNLTYPPRYQGAPGRPVVGDGILGPAGSPAAHTPGGAAYGAGSSPAAGVPGLFSGASSNIWLAILFGGVLLYAAVEK